MRSISRKGQRALFYGCTNFHLRGRTVCTNSMLIPMEAANSAVLAVFEQEVLHPAVTDTVIKKAVAKFKTSQQEKTNNIDRYCERISQLDIEVKRLVSAVSAGGDIPALVVALKENTDRRAALSDELAELNKVQGLDQTDYDELEAKLRAHFRQSWEALMTRQVAQARQILAKLFNGERVPFSPAGSGYEFKGIASAGKQLIGHAKGLVSPIGTCAFQCRISPTSLSRFQGQSRWRLKLGL